MSHVLAYAAMADGYYVYLSNNTGLAQKGGPVEAPILLSKQRQPSFNRLMPGGADLYLGFDLLRAAEPQNLRFAAADRSIAAVSTTRIPTAAMNRHPERTFPDPEALANLVDECSSKMENLYLDTYWLAEVLFGDSIYANVILVGAAFQAGLIPLRGESIEDALRLNGRAIEDNILAFRLGRLSVADPTELERRVGSREPAPSDVIEASRTKLQGRPDRLELHDRALESIGCDVDAQRLLSVRIAELCDYQGLSYATYFTDFVSGVHAAELALGGGHGLRLTRAVIANLYKLMAYKDEYEIARLATKESVLGRVRSIFEGPVKISYHLHPPSLRWLGVGKVKLGDWIRPVFWVLRRMRRLRSTWMDPFGRTECRRLERELVTWYQTVVTEALGKLTADTYDLVAKILEAPDDIRGYEDVKIESAERTRSRVEELREELLNR